MDDDNNHWLVSIDGGSIQGQHNHYDDCKLFFQAPNPQI